jgi:hypothetical protein
MDEQDTRAALVLMEAGTQWPSYAREIRSRASSAIVEAQQPSESLAEFSNRVVQRLHRMQMRRIRIPVAVLAVNGRVDFEATTLRYRTALAVLEAISDDGELVVIADESTSDESRHELLAFAGALCDAQGRNPVNVRVRFSTGSGIRPLVGAPLVAEEPPLSSTA